MHCHIVVYSCHVVNFVFQRGFEVCQGSEPLDAICRIASDPATVFNEHTTSFTRDQLHVPCSRKGVVCRDVDQEYYDGQRTCSDYAIRFECLGKDATSHCLILNMSTSARILKFRIYKVWLLWKLLLFMH